MTDLQSIKPQLWNGKSLSGEWLVTVKVDGIRALWHGERGWLSRACKPLYNIPPHEGGAHDCELYVGSFRETIQATRTKFTKADTPVIRREHLFALYPLDARLNAGTMTNPRADEILEQLRRVQALGFEGLVLRQGECWVKVKPSETYDLAVTGFSEGRGKYAGRLGSLVTARGSVGAGFSDEERSALLTEGQAGVLIGQVVEVSCMMLTEAGMFRHPRFIRMRPDKLVAAG